MSSLQRVAQLHAFGYRGISLAVQAAFSMSTLCPALLSSLLTGQRIGGWQERIDCNVLYVGVPAPPITHVHLGLGVKSSDWIRYVVDTDAALVRTYIARGRTVHMFQANPTGEFNAEKILFYYTPSCYQQDDEIIIIS